MATNKAKTSSVDEKPVNDAPSNQEYSESVENDKAVQDAKATVLGEDQKPLEEQIEDTPENKDFIEEDKQFKEDIASGDVQVIGSIPGYNQSVAQQPLVKDYLSDRPVYPTAEAAMLAQAAQGKLSTEAPSAADIEAAKGEDKEEDPK